MKKTYIIPCTSVEQLESVGLIMASANIVGNADVRYGGRSEGGMSSDTKEAGSWSNIWE